MAAKGAMARAVSSVTRQASVVEVSIPGALPLQHLLEDLSRGLVVIHATDQPTCHLDAHLAQHAHHQHGPHHRQDSVNVSPSVPAAMQSQQSVAAGTQHQLVAAAWQQLLLQQYPPPRSSILLRPVQRHPASCQYSSIPPGRNNDNNERGTSEGGSGTGSTSSGNGSGTAAAAGAAAAPMDSLTAALHAMAHDPKTAQLTPRAITQQLDKHIVGQAAAKRAVAVALRNRWRRHRLPQHVAEEITPKNILMIGPTGCGKTEIARRLAKLVEAPFVKVEATKFTELGFVGRDVDEIVKDLMEASLTLTRQRLSDGLRQAAGEVVEELLLRELCGPDANSSVYQTFRPLYREGKLDDRIVDIDLDALENLTAAGPNLGLRMGPDSQGGPASHNLGTLYSLMEAMSRKAQDGHPGMRRRGKQKMKVADARRFLLDHEVERALQSDRVVKEALRAAQEDGIVFIDEIDKIVDTSKGAGGATSSNVSSEGVQRDLLPILEGSTVATKYGNVATDHVLFIASGAFHSSKPSDMLAELQGRLPVRVELAGLTADDFYRILTEPQHNMLRQQKVLLATEGVDLHFTDGAVRAIAKAAEEANKLLDNIGARRLHTVLERVLADVSFEADKLVAAAKAAKATSSSSHENSTAAGSTAGGADGGKTTGKVGKRHKHSTSSSAAASSTSASFDSSGASAAISSNSRTDSSGGSSGSNSSEQGELVVRYEVTEEMVEACMKEVLKHQDLSRYVL